MAIINPSWTQIQTGLYLETVVGTHITYSILHSADGYCFYDLNDEYYDEQGNVIPQENVTPEMRIYYQWMATPETDIAVLNSYLVSVPIQPEFEIVNKPNTPEIM